MKRLAIFLAGLSGAMLPAAAAEEKVPVPAQCYEEASQEGIPKSYNRESLVDQPVLVQRIEPDFPTQPTESRDFYCAAFMFSVGEDGRVRNVDMLYDSHPGIEGVFFGEMAENALRSWQYQPGMIDKQPAEFLGFTAVFYRGFGDAADLASLRQEAGSASRIANDIAEDWRSYGRMVSDWDIEVFETAAETGEAPSVIAAQKPKILKAPKPRVPTRWVVADDGTVMTDEKVYAPGSNHAVANTEALSDIQKQMAFAPPPENYGEVSQPFYADGTPVVGDPLAGLEVQVVRPDFADDPYGDVAAAPVVTEDAAILESFGIGEASETGVLSFPPLVE